MSFSYVQNRRWWYGFSALLIVVSFLSLAVWGVRFGIDFTGGSLIEMAFTQERPSMEALRETFGSLDVGAQIQPSDEQGLLVRSRSLSEEEHQRLLQTVHEKHGDITELRFDSIGPVIGKELRRTAFTSVVAVLVLIGLYVAWAFRKVSEPIASWKYGLLTIATAFHDVFIALGAFSILGHFYGWEVGTTFVAAALTILGYSINDTIVVFDRTRENLASKIGATFADTVEISIHQTILRSLYTTITTLLALVAIFVFGGETTRPFALALIIGIAVGAYSSIFIASPFLASWEHWKNRTS